MFFLFGFTIILVALGVTILPLAAATRRRRPYPSSEQRTPHQNSDSEAMAAQVSRFDPARLLSFVHADLERH